MTEREMKRRKAAVRKARARKQRNRRVALTVCLMLAVCLVSVGGTIAWLTDETSDVVNTFSTSDINIHMQETVNGTTKTTENGDVENNGFKMVPGTTETKDPAVVVKADSEDCWVFVEVTEAGGGEKGFDYFVSYAIDSTNWTLVPGETNVWYTSCTNVTSDRTINVLQNKQVSYSDDITKADMNGLTAETYPNLTFKAYAIQKAEFSTVADAWAEISGDATT